jgi:hypothetical protein
MNKIEAVFFNPKALFQVIDREYLLIPIYSLHHLIRYDRFSLYLHDTEYRDGFLDQFY